MEPVGRSTLWSFLDGAKEVAIVTNGHVRSDPGFRVKNYLDLAARIAELQYRNRNHVLVFRGQRSDWRTVKGFTTFKPSIFRPLPGKTAASDALVSRRYGALEKAELLLAEAFEKQKRLGRQRVARERMLRWALLQHYEVCPTPLLDVSHSLRVAASFASMDAEEDCFVYALAVPNLSGAVTANAEGGLQILRLASVCPPAAIRPHIQEGYLLGEYPEMMGMTQKQKYKAYEMDFGRRIVAKFRFDAKTFWTDESFPPVPKAALYPRGRDWLENLTASIMQQVKV